MPRCKGTTLKGKRCLNSENCYDHKDANKTSKSSSKGSGGCKGITNKGEKCLNSENCPHHKGANKTSKSKTSSKGTRENKTKYYSTPDDFVKTISIGAAKRLNRGPCKNDHSDGSVYLYKEDGIEDIIKMGYVQNFDNVRKRIRQQATNNKKSYTMQGTSIDCKHAYLLEQVVRRHLIDIGRHSPNGKGDGHTEWYNATVEETRRLLKDVKELIDGKYK